MIANDDILGAAVAALLLKDAWTTPSCCLGPHISQNRFAWCVTFQPGAERVRAGRAGQTAGPGESLDQAAPRLLTASFRTSGPYLLRIAGRWRGSGDRRSLQLRLRAGRSRPASVFRRSSPRPRQGLWAHSHRPWTTWTSVAFFRLGRPMRVPGSRLWADFNTWDGRRHPIAACATRPGVWDCSCRGWDRSGALQDSRVVGRDGSMLQKADPMARQTEAPPATASRRWARAPELSSGMMPTGWRSARRRHAVRCADLGLRGPCRILDEARGGRRSCARLARP